MNTSAQAFRCFGVDVAKAHETPERRLNVAAGTAKPVVQIEMTECGVEIIAPHQDNHAAAEPDAFRVAGRAIDGLRRLDEFVGLALAVLGGIGSIGGGFARRVLGGRGAALGEGASDTDQDGNPGNGEAAQNQVLKLKHPSTHAFPDLLPARGRSWRAGFDAVQIGPQCGGDSIGFP